MGRLTAKRVNGIKTGYWSPEKKEDLVQRLAAYEDTGLTPEEIKEYTGWRFTSLELPPSPTKEQIDRRLNEYIVHIEGAVLATTLYYCGENIWTDDVGELYAVVAWMPLPKVSNQ